MFEDLPAEVHSHIAQFLGDSVQETIKNIVTLGTVNKALYDTLLAKRDNITRIITERFHKKEIAKAFLTALETSKKLDQIKPFFELHLISKEDISLLFKIKPDWLKALVMSKKVNETAQETQALGSGRLFLKRTGKYGTNQPYQFIKSLIAYLIDKGFLDPNTEYNGKTLLHLAAKIGDWGMLEDLQELGANINNPTNQLATRVIKKKFSPNFLRNTLGYLGN
jgi:hypothetical protein